MSISDRNDAARGGDYATTFAERGHLYHRANARWPEARSLERRRLIELLRVVPGNVVCDVPAGGGYLADGLGRFDVRVICLEPVAAFARNIDARFEARLSSIERFDLHDGAVDRVASLAALHHLDDKAAFARECFRVLRSGGRVALGDVLADTDAARFLGDAADRLSSTGHRSRFITPGELTRHLTAAGFVMVEEAHHPTPWHLPDGDALIAFARDLFGLTADDTTIGDELARAFDPISIAGATIPWELTYAAALKP